MILILSIYLIYDYANKAQKGEIREGLTRVSNIISQQIDGERHKTFVSNAQRNTESYRLAIEPLKKALQADASISYIYTGILKEGKVYFILDPVPEGDNDGDGVVDHVEIMQEYTDVSDSMLTALKEKRSVISDKPYKDQWGTFISTYTPFYDRNNDFVGVLGVDITAKNYIQRLTPIRKATIYSLIISFVLSFLMGFGIYWTRKYKEKILIEKEKEYTLSLLKRYAPPEIISDIANRKNPLERKFERIKKVVVFSDIFKSTTLSEKLSLEEFSRILNDYYEITDPIIIKYGGTISRLTGDGLLAYFTPENVKNGVQACLDVLSELKAYRSKADNLRKYLYAGFSLTLGTVFTGNIGCSSRKDFTVIGDTVNTSARLESLTHEREYLLLMDSNVANEVKDTMKVKEVGTYQPKGMQVELPIFTVDEPQIYNQDFPLSF